MMITNRMQQLKTKEWLVANNKHCETCFSVMLKHVKRLNPSFQMIAEQIQLEVEFDMEFEFKEPKIDLKFPEPKHDAGWDLKPTVLPAEASTQIVDK